MSTNTPCQFLILLFVISGAEKQAWSFTSTIQNLYIDSRRLCVGHVSVHQPSLRAWYPWMDVEWPKIFVAFYELSMKRIFAGYFARMAALKQLMQEFLNIPSDDKQIISLGAGFDTTYFHLQVSIYLILFRSSLWSLWNYTCIMISDPILYLDLPSAFWTPISERSFETYVVKFVIG